jgi:aspartate/methionine/tyrosine aminotransferase
MTVEARPQVRDLARSLIRQVANEAMNTPGCLPFHFGESDEATPEFIRRAGMASLERGETFYTQSLGRPWLRDGISRYLTGLHGRPVAADRIAVVGSGTTGVMLTAQLLLSPGDRVVAVTPLWPNALEIPRVMGAHVDCVGLENRGGRWDLDVDRLLAALTPATRLLILNSPNNPTGWAMGAEARDAILAHCRRHGIWIMGDDVYERLIYDGSRVTPTFLAKYEDGDRIISVNSFSKAWSMTGWRLGWMVQPPALIDDMTKLIEFNFSSTPEFSQHGGLAAVEGGEDSIAELITRLGTCKRVLTEALATMPGVELPESQGAMYLFFRLPGSEDSLALSKRLVRVAGIGLAPGAAFGAAGEGWLRWCYASKPDRILQGVDRLKTFLTAKGAAA